MRREIKFRVWDKKNKKFIDESLINLNPCGTISILKDKSIGYLYYGKELDCELISLSFFTGLKDANGKEIYEGDIAIGDHPMTPALKNPSEIVFEGSGFKVKFTGRYGDIFLRPLDIFFGPVEVKFTRFEIIGNIYENPELLEEIK